MFRQYDLEDGLWSAKVEDAWYSHVPEAISKRTLSVKFNAGKLRINVNSSVVRNELMLMKDDLKTALNERLEQPVIEEIIIS